MLPSLCPGPFLSSDVPRLERQSPAWLPITGAESHGASLTVPQCHPCLFCHTMQKAVSILRAVREVVHSLSESSCLYVQSGMNGHGSGRAACCSSISTCSEQWLPITGTDVHGASLGLLQCHVCLRLHII